MTMYCPNCQWELEYTGFVLSCHGIYKCPHCGMKFEIKAKDEDEN